jgi:hypothetical protein
MATDTPATLSAAAGMSSSNFATHTEDFARLRSDELKAALGDLGATAAQAVVLAQNALNERAVERKRVADAFKTAAVKRQLDAVPALKAQAERLMAAEAKTAAEDKHTHDALALLSRLAAAALPANPSPAAKSNDI